MTIEKELIFLTDTVQKHPYGSSKNGRGSANYPDRANPIEHVSRIISQLKKCREQSLSPEQVAAIHYKEGMYLEFSGVKGKDLDIGSLENLREGIRLLNVRYDEADNNIENDNAENDDDKEKIVRATVYVPKGKEGYFLKKAEKYRDSLDKDKEKKPSYNNLIQSIEDVKTAVVESFWTGRKKYIPIDQKSWCEIWLRVDLARIKNKEDAVEKQNQIEKEFRDFCEKHKITVDEKRVVFPERIVVMADVNRKDLETLIEGYDNIAEMRPVQTAVTFFQDLPGSEKREWGRDLLERTTFQDSNASVCILDRGINEEHPLLKPAVMENGVQAVESKWKTEDDDGHGTAMAGVALYDDLQEKLESSDPIEIHHKIESVKILPPRGANPPELYGAITDQAVLLAEINNPLTERCFCLAVTACTDKETDGTPSSWSGTLDAIAAGTDDESKKRLIVVSAGDVPTDELRFSGYPNANILHGVEDPGQAWNALTVGGYSKDSLILSKSPSYIGSEPVAAPGELSPFSATSYNWRRGWPIKPEVLFDGNNAVTNGDDYSDCEDFKRLTTSRNLSRYFDTIDATSSAAAQAAYMAAEIFAAYPGIWPETVRGLIVHSARWTEAMKKQFCGKENNKTARKNLLRTCGYGIPDLGRAVQCMDNSVSMVIEGELQPFAKNPKTGSIGMNEMHIHELPWPEDVLRNLGNVNAELRVTLSYFIEPGPGNIGWKNRYRYASCGLKFDVQNTNESLKDFEKRIDVRMRDDEEDKGEGTSGSNRWYLGAKNRDTGSIHSDFIKTSAVNLCGINHIAVYPVIGWWKERSYLNRYNRKVRYALIVTISTPGTKTDLYTPILNQIKNPIMIANPNDS